MQSIVIIFISGVLVLFFFSGMNVYKSLYKKVSEEKKMLENQIEKLEDLISRYDKKSKSNASVLKDNQDNLDVARDDLQNIRVENSDLKHKLFLLQKRADELYAQVNTMV